MTPSLPPGIPKVKITPLPLEQQQALASGWNPFNRLQHEALMNSWLMNEQQTNNAKKVKAYCLAYSDYKTNAEIYASLNPPIDPPPPPPPPQLEDIGPMPTGYWYGQHA